MQTKFKEIGMRINGLREACDVTVEDMARDLDVSVETYTEWETTGANVPISAIYHMASKFCVDFDEILTGKAAHLNTYQITRACEEHEIDRYPGYHFTDFAWRFSNKIMQPLKVTIEPSQERAALVTHSGQEFNYVVSGTIGIMLGKDEFILETGDSIYFNPEIPHGQFCVGDVPGVFLTVITE